MESITMIRRKSTDSEVFDSAHGTTAVTIPRSKPITQSKNARAPFMVCYGNDGLADVLSSAIKSGNYRWTAAEDIFVITVDDDSYTFLRIPEEKKWDYPGTRITLSGHKHYVHM